MAEKVDLLAVKKKSVGLKFVLSYAIMTRKIISRRF